MLSLVLQAITATPPPGATVIVESSSDWWKNVGAGVTGAVVGGGATVWAAWFTLRRSAGHATAAAQADRRADAALAALDVLAAARDAMTELHRTPPAYVNRIDMIHRRHEELKAAGARQLLLLGPEMRGRWTTLILLVGEVRTATIEVSENPDDPDTWTAEKVRHARSNTVAYADYVQASFLYFITGDPWPADADMPGYRLAERWLSPVASPDGALDATVPAMARRS